jgi:hypothetical protein
VKLTTDSAGDVGSYGVAMRHASGRLLQLRFLRHKLLRYRCAIGRGHRSELLEILAVEVEVEILAVKAATLRLR